MDIKKILVEAIEDDILNFLENPTSVKNIQEKVATYLGSISNPWVKNASVQDSWMIRAGFGNSKLSTYTGDSYKLVHEAMNYLARQLGLPPATVQEIIWKNARIAASDAGESFLPLTDTRVLFPNLAAGAQRPEALPSFFDLATKMAPANRRFEQKIIKAIEKNPELAKYFQISGEDVEVTDEFFKAMSFFK
jgi:hypothetical protein